MSLVNKVANRIRRDGLRGASAAAMYRLAAALEPQKSERVDAAPDYLGWLGCAVPGMLCRGNIDAMEHALQHLPNDAPMLEIGSFCGLSTCVMSYLALKHSVKNRLFTCDRWGFEGQDLTAHLGEHPTITQDEYRTFARDSFLRNTTMFCRPNLPCTIEADSDTFFQRWSAGENAADVFGRSIALGGPLSFCYIDGNHTYDFARRDFENTDRYLTPGGFILFDDSADGSGWQVCRVVAEVLKAGAYEVILKNPNYLFRKRA